MSPQKKLGVEAEDYITKNYATLFTDWQQETRTSAEEDDVYSRDGNRGVGDFELRPVAVASTTVRGPGLSQGTTTRMGHPV